MITQYGTRRRGHEFFTDMPARHETTTERALKSLIDAELKFGGRIKDLSPTKVVVETQVLACLDTTYFEGSKEEMEPLVVISYYYAKAQAEQRDGIVEDAVSEYEKLPPNVKGSPFFVVNLSPMIFGNATLRRAIEMMQQERGGG
jgi:hypothetical protein